MSWSNVSLLLSIYKNTVAMFWIEKEKSVICLVLHTTEIFNWWIWFYILLEKKYKAEILRVHCRINSHIRHAHVTWLLIFSKQHPGNKIEHSNRLCHLFTCSQEKWEKNKKGNCFQVEFTSHKSFWNLRKVMVSLW